MRTIKNNPPTDQVYLNLKQVAEYLGRSEGALRMLCLRKKIPYKKPAGRLLFSRDEIDRWIRMAEGVSLEEIFESRK